MASSIHLGIKEFHINCKRVNGEPEHVKRAGHHTQVYNFKLLCHNSSACRVYVNVGRVRPPHDM